MQSTRVCVKVTSSISVTPIQSSYVPFRRDIRFYSSLNRINRVYTSLSHLTGLERCDILYWMDFSYLEMEFLFWLGWYLTRRCSIGSHSPYSILYTEYVKFDVKLMVREIMLNKISCVMLFRSFILF